MANRRVDHNLTAEYVRSVLNYNSATGIMTWRDRHDVDEKVNTRYAGQPAGWVSRIETGHMKITLNGASYFYHRLAWLHFYGCWPVNLIDHIDGDPQNNAIINLRNATSNQNSQNQKVTKSDGIRLKGARFHKQSGRWQASIIIDGKSKYLGLFDTAEAAHIAYCKAAAHFHGEYARFA